jgi:hypothetical protein
VAGDVLRRLAGGSLVNQEEVVLGFLQRQIHLDVGVKKSAVAMEDVHQQQFSGELCGRDLVVEKGFETGLESCAELHGGKQKAVGGMQ